MPEENIGARYNIADNIKERFYQLPKGLFLYPRYRNLDPQAKIMYAILLDRLQLSKVNQWIDDNGDIYLGFSQDKLADLLCCSQSAVSKTMKKLESAGLLERYKVGLHSLQRIYIHKLVIPDPSEIIEDVSEANLTVNDNREILEAQLHKLEAMDEKYKPQKVKQKEQKVQTFPEEYMESQKQNSKHSQRNIGETLEKTQTFPEEYMESQKQNSKHSQRNIPIFPEEYPDIPVGISKHSCRNTNETNISDTELNETEYSETNTHIYSGSAAERARAAGRNRATAKPAENSPYSSLVDLVKTEIYFDGYPMPGNVLRDINEAVNTYPMDMIKRAIETTKKFHKHSFAYTMRILGSWQEEINGGNAEPWAPQMTRRASSEPDYEYDIDFDELDRKQVFPWNQ